MVKYFSRYLHNDYNNNTPYNMWFTYYYTIINYDVVWWILWLYNRSYTYHMFQNWDIGPLLLSAF